MGKARKMGVLAAYTPNSKVEMRNKPKLFERRQQIYDETTLRSERRRHEKELKELERMKREANCDIAQNIESCEDCGFCAMLERKKNG